MADIKKQADLMHILPAQETRIRKMERQLSVPRTEYSSVAASDTTASSLPVALAAADQVTVVTSAVCLIHIYFEVTASTTAGTLSIYVRDHDAANGAGVNTLAAQTASTSPENVCSSELSRGQIVPYGSFMTFTNTPKWDSAANNHTFSLRYSTTAGTATFVNRKLFAWVQPF